VVDGRVESVPVTVGIRGTGLVEVQGALADGDLVISPRPANLADGAHVRPVLSEVEAPQP